MEHRQPEANLTTSDYLNKCKDEIGIVDSSNVTCMTECGNARIKSECLPTSETAVPSSGFTLDCDRCEKTFKSKLGLQKHQLKHTESGPFACDYCEAKFTGSNGLRIHRRLHTGTAGTAGTAA